MSDSQEVIDAKVKLWRYAIIENCVTIAAMAAIIIGLYAMGAGAWSFWGFILLININYGKRNG